MGKTSLCAHKMSNRKNGQTSKFARLLTLHIKSYSIFLTLDFRSLSLFFGALWHLAVRSGLVLHKVVEGLLEAFTRVVFILTLRESSNSVPFAIEAVFIERRDGFVFAYFFHETPQLVIVAIIWVLTIVDGEPDRLNHLGESIHAELPLHRVLINHFFKRFLKNKFN